MCQGLARRPWPAAASIMGKGRDVAGANVEPNSLQPWPGGCNSPCQQKGSRTHTGRQGPGPIPCSPCPGRRGGRARPLGSGRGGSCWQQCPPPPFSAEGSAGVGFGCPCPACPQGPASPVADPPWGQVGSPGSDGEGFPLGWHRRMGASRATGQPGCWPAGISHCLSCCHLPACLIVSQRALGRCWPLSPSLGVTLGHHGVSVPSHAWLPPGMAAAMKASSSQQRCSSSKTPLPNQKPPTCVHPVHPLSPLAPRWQVSSCWDWGSWTDLTQPGPCCCPHGAGQCRRQG